jgi:transmembrane sensor
MIRETASTAADEAARWFARQQSNAMTPRERRQLDEWLAGGEANRIAFAECAGVWNLAEGAADDQAILAMRREALAIGRAPARRTWLRAGMAIAATLVLVVMGSAYLVGTRQVPFGRETGPSLAQQGAHVYRTIVGQRSSIALADGSVVELNTDSELHVDLGSAIRHFALVRGQALFRVAHDRDRPFVVKAGGKAVTALGTVFDVDLRPRELRVTLLEGRVSVRPLASGTDGAREQARDLQPGQQLIAHVAQPLEIRSVNVDQVVSWREGRVVFNDERLGDVLPEINRYSQRKVVLGDPDLADLRISGTFRTGAVDRFAAALNMGFAIDTRVDRNHNVVLSRRP